MKRRFKNTILFQAPPMNYHINLQAILFIDLCDYTATTAKLTPEEFTTWQDYFDHYVEEMADKYQGKIIKKIGDGFLLTFETSTKALLGAQALRKQFMDHNKKESLKLYAKMTVHVGEVMWKKNDIYGTAVNIAARMLIKAKTHEIIFTGTVALTLDKNQFNFEHLGPSIFKGVSIPVRLFKLLPRKTKSQKTPKQKKIWRRLFN